MIGPEGCQLEKEDPTHGIVPRACLQLLSGLPAGFSVNVAYMEVYNDSINDLLELDKTKYSVLHEVDGHVEPQNLTRQPVANLKDVMSAIAKGDKRRVIAAMAMNPRSSRGHGLIQLNVTNAEGLQHGRLTLVDLAGMESSKKSAPTGVSDLPVRRQEAKAINQSLLALSSVVNALAAKGGMRIPFRDSKLTRLLQSSLAGNCKSAFIVSLRSEKKNIEEAVGTLRFAQSAKSVAATVIKNEDARKPKGAAAANKLLEEELRVAKAGLADFEGKLAEADSYKTSLMAEVQNLLSEMQSLQKENKDAEKKRRASAVLPEGKMVSPAYVQGLERRIAELEEENRILRQRDIMHRMIQLDGADANSSEAAPKKADAPSTNPNGLVFHVPEKDLVTLQPLAFEATGGFAMGIQKQRSDAELKVPPRLSQRPSAPSTQNLGGKVAAKRRWGVMRVLAMLLGMQTDARSASVHPSPESLGTPKEHAAATKIQAVVRGKAVREELYWELMGY